MNHQFEGNLSEILNLLTGGSVAPVTGSEITIRKVWTTRDQQVGTGFDDAGRKLIFALSLSTGEGIARHV